MSRIWSRRRQVAQAGAGRAALREQVGVVAHQGQRGLHAGLRHVEQAVFAVHHGVGELAHVVAVGLGHADHLRDHVHREQAGEVGDEVEVAPCHGGAQVSAGQRADLVLELAHPPGREALGHQRAHAGVPWRVQRQERHGLVRVPAPGRRVQRDAVGAGEPRRVPERADDVCVPRECPEVELAVAVQRRLVPQPCVDRVRILVDPVVVRAERHRRGHAQSMISSAASASWSATCSYVV
jgi:hypothetical protein